MNSLRSQLQKRPRCSIPRRGVESRWTHFTASTCPIPIAGWRRMFALPRTWQRGWLRRMKLLASISKRFPSGLPSKSGSQSCGTSNASLSPRRPLASIFYLKNDGLQNQAVLYVADTDDGAGRVLIDPNAWSEDGTISLGFMAESDDARYLAYGRKEAGSDWSTST